MTPSLEERGRGWWALRARPRPLLSFLSSSPTCRNLSPATALFSPTQSPWRTTWSRVAGAPASPARAGASAQCTPGPSPGTPSTAVTAYGTPPSDRTMTSPVSREGRGTVERMKERGRGGPGAGGGERGYPRSHRRRRRSPPPLRRKKKRKRRKKPPALRNPSSPPLASSAGACLQSASSPRRAAGAGPRAGAGPSTRGRGAERKGSTRRPGRRRRRRGHRRRLSLPSLVRSLPFCLGVFSLPRRERERKPVDI